LRLLKLVADPSDPNTQACVRLAAGAERVESADNGTRNDTLFRVAATLGEDIGEGRLPESVVYARLIRAADIASRNGAPFKKSEVENTIQSGFRDGKEKALNPVKFPFRLTDTNVEFGEKTEGEAVNWVQICSRLEVIAETRDADGNNWGRLLRFRDRDGKPHEWAMPMSMLAGEGTALRERLLTEGLTILPGKRPRDRLEQYIQRPAEGGDEFFVYPEVFRSEICHGFNPKSAIPVLVARGWMKPVEADGRPKSEHLPKLADGEKRNKQRVYRFYQTVIGDIVETTEPGARL
jgi:Domain of unknown function (DUF927)